MKQRLLQDSLVTYLQILALCKNANAMRWVDYCEDKSGIVQTPLDIFFDRVVLVNIEYKYIIRRSAGSKTAEHKEDKDNKYDAMIKRLKKFYPKILMSGSMKPHVTPGVFITRTHVLTSYNPFRDLFRWWGGDRRSLYVTILVNRMYRTYRRVVEYHVVNGTSECAHQVIPMDEEEMTKEQWHGTDRRHSPLHDLMVIRIKHNAYFFPRYSTPPKYYMNCIYWIRWSRTDRVGARLTEIAKPGDPLDHDVKFASLGFMHVMIMKLSHYLMARTYHRNEAVIEDCEDYFPRYWGHFICIRNIDHYPGLGSGAILIHNSTLYGIGSFALNKGNESILVFTDVRPYYHLIFNTCLPIPAKDIMQH